MRTSDAASIATQLVTFTSGNALNNLPSDLGAGEVVTLSRTIKMPFGTLYFTFFAGKMASCISQATNYFK